MMPERTKRKSCLKENGGQNSTRINLLKKLNFRDISSKLFRTLFDLIEESSRFGQHLRSQRK